MIQRLGPVFCIAIAVALPQDAPQSPSPPTIRADVREVLVPVVVTDKEGHYVTGLARDDFSVSEDGVLQKVVAFSRSPVSAAGVQPDQTTANQTKAAIPNIGPHGQPIRTYLICLDSLHLTFEDFTYVRNTLKKFFREEHAGESQYALMALGRELHVVVDSNRDPQTILAAIDSKALLKTILDSEARNIAMETDRFANLVGAWCGGCPCTNQYMDMTAQNMKCVSLKAQVKSEVLSFPERAATLNGNLLKQLSEVVHAMASMPTRRTVIFFSDGFNRFAGQEFYDILRAFGVNDGTLKFNPRDLQPQLDSILKLAMRWDVRFYTLDSRGLYTHSAVPGSGQDASSRGVPLNATLAAMMTAWSNGDAMAQLARQTGGQFFENSNTLLKGIRTAFADGREEYVLAYVPSNTKVDGQFRKIAVELKDRKLHVAAKVGYWSAP